jgi:mannose-6-phosphate isomerase-like protein (cupin superfamily)
MSAATRSYQIVDFEEIPGVACPCGIARRALADVAELPLTIHRTEIQEDARVHFHKRITETYYILACEPDAAMQLDADRIALRPGLCIMIPPSVRHRAIGRMTVLIVAHPKFDPADEWFD